jgi:hypothetical protein
VTITAVTTGNSTIKITFAYFGTLKRVLDVLISIPPMDLVEKSQNKFLKSGLCR